MEALAVAPGLPDLAEQERRDRVPAGTYRRLAETGALRVAQGLQGATARPTLRRSEGRLGGACGDPLRPASG